MQACCLRSSARAKRGQTPRESAGDDPVKPDHDDRREANGNGDHVQGAINGVAVRTVHNANTAP